MFRNKRDSYEKLSDEILKRYPQNIKEFAQKLISDTWKNLQMSLASCIGILPIVASYSYLVSRGISGANIIKPDKNRKIRADDAARMQFQISGRPPRQSR